MPTSDPVIIAARNAMLKDAKAVPQSTAVATPAVDSPSIVAAKALRAFKQQQQNQRVQLSQIPSRAQLSIPINKPPPSVLRIKDSRGMDEASGKPLNDRNRLHSFADVDLLKNIVKAAKKNGIDPYTAIAMAHQETGLAGELSGNPFHVKYDPDTNDGGDPIDFAMKFMKEKQRIAKSKNKTNEADVIQAWNGYGKIGKQYDDPYVEDDAPVNEWYGIDVSKTPIDFDKNPVYGKRIIDIRENIIKKNPELVQLINSIQ